MKNIVVIIVFSCVLHCVAYTQIAYQDSTGSVRVTGYVGILNGTQVSVEDARLTGSAYIRFGGDVFWKPKQWITCFGLGAIEFDHGGGILPLYNIGVEVMPSRKFSVLVGKIASPMTILRPYPTTGDGQFEPWTKARMLGSAMGGRVSYRPKSKYSATIGGFWRDTVGTIEVGFAVPYVSTGGYYVTSQNTFGGAVTLSYKSISQTVVVTHQDVLALLTLFDIPQVKGVTLYLDVGFDMKATAANGGKESWDLVRGEWGVLKSLSTKHVQALIGMGYAHEVKLVKAYCFVHI